ncbi:uncharacterized protein LOC143290259 [Babylonia areolata]|uniref:uncharacterized protein LOC143290259 n=1 Tax=Babylonia areolata TaxID=304850 RepID=UPI003FD01F0B
MKGVSTAAVVELKSMSNPPAIVKTNILTTLLLLGHYEEETKRYVHAKRELKTRGPGALPTRTAELKAEDVTLNVALGARGWMRDITVEQTKKVAAACAELCEWNLAVIEAVLSRYSEEEISKAEPRTKRYTDEPSD